MIDVKTRLKSRFSCDLSVEMLGLFNDLCSQKDPESRYPEGHTYQSRSSHIKWQNGSTQDLKSLNQSNALIQ